MSAEANRRFLSLTVGEVSLVGEPANEEEWLVAKAKTEDEMTTKSEGEVERVTTKAVDAPSDPVAVQVLKEMGSIVENIMKAAGKGTAAATAATEDPEVEKGMTLKAFLKAAGMDDAMMSKAEEKAKKSGLDFGMKLGPADAKGKDGEKPAAKPADTKEEKTKKGMDGDASLDGLIVALTKGKSLTSKRMEQLKTMKAVLDELMGEIDPPSERVPANLPKGTSPGTAIESISKSADDITAAVEKAVKPLAEKVVSWETELSAVKKARPASASVSEEGGTDGKDAEVKKSMWSGVL